VSGPLAGTASLGVRGLVSGPRRRGRVIVALPAAAYVEIRAPGPEPCILALVTPAAVALPMAVIAGRPAGQDGERNCRGQQARAGESSCLAGLAAGDCAVVGGGVIEAGRIRVRVRRWWDPVPVLAPLSRSRLQVGYAALQALRAASTRRPGLDEHAGRAAPAALAACCATGDAPGAAEAVRRLLGLGPGLTPSGDDMVAGLMLALRLLGAAMAEAMALWLADRLAAMVTRHARDRTTPVSAALLHCAARGQGSPEVAGVLRALGGLEPAPAAVARLLAVGHTSGADLAWGLSAGCQAVLALPPGDRHESG